MNIIDFIDYQVSMLKKGFAESQIRDNVYRYVFFNGVPNIQINTLIDNCMSLYSEIILKSKNNN